MCTSKSSFNLLLIKSEKLSSSQEMVNIYLDEIKDENICLKDELESRQLQLDEARAARSVDDSRLEEVYEIDRSGSKKRALKGK